MLVTFLDNFTKLVMLKKIAVNSKTNAVSHF